VIEEAREATEELAEALQFLVPQLSTSAPLLDRHGLQRIIDSDASHLLVTRNDRGRIVGTLTLVIFVIPTGTRAWIEM
jgi:hypothetical protein